MTAFEEIFKEGDIEKAISLLPQAETEMSACDYARLYRRTAGYCIKKNPSAAREIACYDAGEGKRIAAAALHPRSGEFAAGIEEPGSAYLVLLNESLQEKRRLDVLGPERTKKVVEKLGIWGMDEKEHVLGEDRFACVEYSRTGKLLLCRMMHSLQVWEGDSVTCVHWPAEIHVENRRAVFTPDENMVLTNDNRKVVFRLWDMRTGEVYDNINNREYFPFSSDMLYFPDGKSVITIDYNGKIRGYKDTAQRCSEFGQTDREGNLRLFMTPDGKNLYVLSSEGIDIWYWSHFRQEKKDHFPVELSSAACVSPDGTLLAASRPHSVGVWSIPEKKLLFEIPMPEGTPAENLFFSADGCMLYICRGSSISMQLMKRELVFPGWQDWDEKAEPLYDIFKTRCGKRLSFAETEDWIRDLQDLGFGYIRHEAIIEKVTPAIEELGSFDALLQQIREEFPIDEAKIEKEKVEKNKKTVRGFFGKLILGIVLILG